MKPAGAELKDDGETPDSVNLGSQDDNLVGLDEGDDGDVDELDGVDDELDRGADELERGADELE